MDKVKKSFAPGIYDKHESCVTCSINYQCFNSINCSLLLLLCAALLLLPSLPSYIHTHARALIKIKTFAEKPKKASLASAAAAASYDGDKGKSFSKYIHSSSSSLHFVRDNIPFAILRMNDGGWVWVKDFFWWARKSLMVQHGKFPVSDI